MPTSDSRRIRVLLVYKKNAYQAYLRQRRGLALFYKRSRAFVRADLEQFRKGYEAHRRAMEQVRRLLRARGARVRAVSRGGAADYSGHDLVISVGGDGTFLEAARYVTRQQILGVNSDPARSAGTFCRATARTFGLMFERILRGRVRIRKLSRIRLELNGKPLEIHVLNDILVTDRKPAAMSRYWIKIGKVQEEHRGSGLWISTAAGSTGAIQSAGGRRLRWNSKTIQYRPRELYQWRKSRYRLTGGILPLNRSVTVGSLMREGLICLDGENFTVPFHYGDRLRISASPYPLQLIDGPLKT